MLFQVEMTVRMPHDMDAEHARQIKAREKTYSQDLQRQGKWRRLWRVVGSYSNISIFDVADNAELQDIVSALPLFAYMDINIKPLCRHPSSIRQDDG